MLERIRIWHRKRKYQAGKTVSQFIAPDIRRDVEVIDTSLIDAGVISARIRTWNVLYDLKGLKQKPSFGDVKAIEIDKLWDWSAQLWGGPVPDDEE